MKRTAWLRETRMQRFEKALDAWTEKQLTQAAPPRLLGVCARTFRLRGPLRGDGPAFHTFHTPIPHPGSGVPNGAPV